MLHTQSGFVRYYLVIILGAVSADPPSVVNRTLSLVYFRGELVGRGGLW